MLNSTMVLIVFLYDTCIKCDFGNIKVLFEIYILIEESIGELKSKCPILEGGSGSDEMQSAGQKLQIIFIDIYRG